ncbi:nuclear poly(A) polymerase 3 isoform X1 [Alnus glutinosa]|uniref:nuclear poly(A) polymerase 3 isoform X1 n=3 Tax=Alnus glutinosa TaxID=3517 RepID=UPI002D794D22|nr:nuclear poly(A) polymerase 3 isoform X1 [Alnus glutinosa]
MAAHAYHNRNGVVFLPLHKLTGSFPSVNPNLVLVPQPFVPLNPRAPQVLVPYNPSVLPLARMDEERSISLLQFMVNEGLVLSPEEEEKRRNVILKLKQIVLAWIKKVAWQRQFPREQISATSATILTYGSYGLGVHGLESDIDALCAGPSFATMAEDFFVVLCNMLKSRPEVSEIHCVKDAKVPLMRFKFDGISVDLPYAQLQVLSVPENVDILNPFFLLEIDETSWKSLSGVRANKRILQLVPNLENFQSMLRCVKLWAKRRGVYGNLLGFLGGVHLAILAAFVCQKHPNASLNALIMNFFQTFAFWPWPAPVILQDGMLPTTGDATETRSLMPIRLPCSPHEYCHSNITRSTCYRIRAEFLQGYAMTRDILKLDFDWGSIFEPFPYTKKYTRFVKIYLSATKKDELGDWVGWVKSRFRCLLVKLEEMQGFCDPNPTEYVDMDVTEPNVVFYWGLNPSKSSYTDVESVEEDFMKNINNGYQDSPGRMKLSIVQASQVPKSALRDTGSGNGTKACWKILDYNRQRIPMYSQHLPHYFVGYAVASGEPDQYEYPSGGC